jgi:hypothetical protein
LWTPFPGAQTLEFTPYRVNLTPFAGVLSNGKSHTITLSVDNADQYFSDIAALLIYRDPRAKIVTGGITSNNLVLNPVATTTENITDTIEPMGTINVTNSHTYEIDGYVRTSTGTVQTSVVSALGFSNLQTYSNETPVTGTEEVQQTTTDTTTTTTVSHTGASTVTSYVSFPLTLNLTSATAAETISIDQQNYSSLDVVGPGSTSTTSYISNTVEPTDVYQIADGAVTGNSAQQSTQTYESVGSDGTCYDQTLTEATNTLVGVTNGTCTAASARARLQWLRRTQLRPLPNHMRRIP